MYTSRQCERVFRGVSLHRSLPTLILMLVGPWLTVSAHPLATPLIFNVVAKNVTSTSATITWSTTKPADTQVAYFIGTAKPTWSACCSPTNATAHSLTVRGLVPNTTYNFFVESTPTGSSTPVDSATSTFHTSGNFTISNVLATNVTTTTATITWTTSQPADTQVAYFIGTAKPTWSACCAPMNVTSHSFTLTGLLPETTYNFFVESTPTGSSTPVDSRTSTFQTARLQTINLGPGQGPDLVVDGNGNIDLAWTNAGVVFGRSADGGMTFTTTSVSPGSFFDGMGVDGLGHITLLSQNLDAMGRRVFSLDISSNGTSFASTDVSSLVLNENLIATGVLVAPSGTTNLPQLAANIGIYDGVVAQKQIVKVSEDFDVDFELTAASGPQGQIYLAWEKQSEAAAECAIMFSVSLDGGLTFSRPQNVSNNPAECAEFPQLNVDSGGRVNLAWTTISGFEDNGGPLVNPNVLYFARSTDQGQTWSTPAPLVGINEFTGKGDDFSGVGDPQIATEPNGAIDVVFDATSSTDTIALFSRSTDGGQTFSPHLTLATSGANSPVVAVDSCGGIDVAYAGATDIFFTRSTDGGSTFAPPTNRSNSGVSEFNPLIAISGKNAYITWEDSTNVYFQTIKVCP